MSNGKETQNVKVLVNMTAKLKEEIETYQFEQRIPSRNEAIRTLIKKSLNQYNQQNEPTK